MNSDNSNRNNASMNHTFRSHLCDAHTHIGAEKEIRERITSEIRSLICASTPSEAARLQTIISKEDWETNKKASRYLIPTYGLHPWQADKYKVSDIKPFFSSCPVIGEIGMDSVWCNVSLEVQEAVFREQLLIASELKKPVILHTKGCEKRIAGILKDYDNTYLIHWYSSPENLFHSYPADSYYSIGPDVWWNEAVRQVVKQVPLERLLVETDGMSAVAWAWKEAPGQKRGAAKTAPGNSIARALSKTIEDAAAIKGLSCDCFEKQMEINFIRFLTH